MRTSILGLTAAALAAFSAPALAQDEAPASDLTLTAGASVVTDYRFRGVSQTKEQFAVQGTLGVSHSSGFYTGVWGSTVDFDNGQTQEIDIYAGYKFPVGIATIDAGVVYYYYPGSAPIEYSDFPELYLSASVAQGPASIKVGAAYAPKAKALAFEHERDDNLYVYGDVGYSLGEMAPITLKGHLGSSFGRSFLTGYDKSYLDWSVGADYVWKNLTLGVSYVDTDIKHSSNPFFVEDYVDATVVGSITVAF